MFPPFAIGSLLLSSPLILSPMAGYTQCAFRRIVRQIGGVGLCTTDLVNARSLLEKKTKAFKLIETAPDDAPLAVQLFGANTNEMAEAARMLEGLGVACIDINMGCPAPKVCGVGGGSALLRDWKKAASLASAVVAAVGVPVTCKMRLGWDKEHLTAPYLAMALAEAGVKAVCVHGRTRDQGYAGQVDLDGIRRVVEAAPSIPVIGNGDIVSHESAKKMLVQTGCAGIGIGRGAFYNPWIFVQTQAYLETGVCPPPPTLDERLDVMRRHLDGLCDSFDEATACRMFRKIAPLYAKQIGGGKAFNRSVSLIESKLDFEKNILEYRANRAVLGAAP